MQQQTSPPDIAVEPTGPFRSLANPAYRLLWASSFSRYFALWMELTILGWLTLHITDSPFKVILVGVYRTIPYAVVGPFSGLIGEKISRKLVIQIAAVVSVVASAILAFLILFDEVRFWHIAVVAGVLGSTVALEFPARRALTRELVGSRMVVNAMALDIMGFTLSNIGGGALGGGLIAVADAGVAFSVVVFVYGLNVFFLLGLRPAWSSTGEERNFLLEMRQAIGYIRTNRIIMGVLVTTVAANLLAFPFILFFPVFARDILDVGPALLGVMTSAFGVGTLIGSVTLAAMVTVRRPGATFVVATALLSLTALIFAASKDYGLSVVMLMLCGVGMSGFAIFQSALLLVVASDAFRARVMGVLSLAIGTGPLGMLMVGLLSKWVGVPWAVGLAEGAMLLCLVVVAIVYRPLMAQMQEG